LIRCVSILCTTLFACAAAAAESQGFSPARLERVTDYVQSAIDQGQYAGAVTLIAQRGQIVQLQALGHRDVARKDPMQPDSIFQIYSMTKPIVSAAALLLLDERKLSLDDPVSSFIPQFANMQVLEGDNASTARLRPAVRPITVRHLLTHTAGFAAGEKLKGPAVDRMLAADLDESPSIEATALAVSALPLANDPGTRFSYDGVSTRVLSRVIEVAARMPFDEFLRTRLIGPLRMVDTSFTVPHDQRHRIVEMTSTDAEGRVITAGVELNPAGTMIGRYPSAAGGLYSTAGDYARFCQMLLNGGELDGVRILSRKTVESMMSNHLTHLSPPVNEFSDAEGFGLGGYVVLDPARRGLLGSVGQFGWSGAAATWFTIDPQQQLIAILMMQHLPRRLPRDPPRLNRQFNNLVYEVLTGAP
jgi:CubicO group peptidase (beta-lactamase class C family)